MWCVYIYLFTRSDAEIIDPIQNIIHRSMLPELIKIQNIV